MIKNKKTVKVDMLDKNDAEKLYRSYINELALMKNDLEGLNREYKEAFSKLIILRKVIGNQRHTYKLKKRKMKKLRVDSGISDLKIRADMDRETQNIVNMSNEIFEEILLPTEPPTPKNTDPTFMMMPGNTNGNYPQFPKKIACWIVMPPPPPNKNRKKITPMRQAIKKTFN